jgi:hypothetical protein
LEIDETDEEIDETEEEVLVVFEKEVWKAFCPIVIGSIFLFLSN